MLDELAVARMTAKAFPADQILATYEAKRALGLADLKIRTKLRELLTFVPNPVQAAYLDDLLPDWRQGDCTLRGAREIILKARQFGFSTLILGLFFLDTITVPRTYTVVVAHDADSTERLFQIVKRYFDNLPDSRRPRTKYNNRRELYFSDLDSTFYVGQAGSRDFGRSNTINNVLCSEAASYPDAEELVSGLLQAVPRDGNVVLESTAKGVGNWYHEEYQIAELGESAFTPRFYGWNRHHEYQVAAGTDFQRNTDEVKLAQAYDLTDAQLAWRREKLKEVRSKFPQEYPINALEAFMASTGRVLAEFIPLPAPKGHLVPDFIPPRSWRHTVIIDPGWKVTAATWWAADPEGMVWQYAEHYRGQLRPLEHVAMLDAMWRVFGRPDIDCLMDPAGFDLKRNSAGRESPSDAAEYQVACEQLGVKWLRLQPANNGDPNASRVKRYLAADLVRVSEGCTKTRWEIERWVWKDPLSGRAAMQRRDPDQPIDRFNHAMDTWRYFFNTLPEELPTVAPPEPLTEERVARLDIEAALKRRNTREGYGPMGTEW